MEQVYALFDRRCRTQTALDKLAKLQRHVQRFPALGDTLEKLFAPTLGKSPDVSLPQAVALNLKCGGAGQPALSQDAKAGLPCAHASTDLCPLGTGYVA